MKVDSLVKVPNTFSTNNEKLSHKIEIGDPEIILSYMRKESYKYHLRTAIQEYLSNALDAHREVKQTKKCQVFAPTNDKPTLIIKDFGPGISPERMEKIFCKVGVSSKRASQNEKGGFGAGSKIGLAYCDTVIIITNVDGLKYLYNLTVSRNPGGEVILMGEPRKTDEPNGTEIHLPILHHDIPKAYKAIQRFCFFAEANETPDCFFLPDTSSSTIHHFEKSLIGEKNDKLGNVYLIENGQLPMGAIEASSDCIIVLDGIPYPIDAELKNPLLKAMSKLNSQTLVIHFKNGVLDTQLSREGLQNNEKNKNAIQLVARLIEKNIEKEIKEMLGEDISLHEKILAFTKIDDKYQVSSVQYKNFIIYSSRDTEHNVRITHPILNTTTLNMRTKNSKGIYKPAGKRSVSETSSIPASNQCVFILDPTLETKTKVGMKLNYLGKEYSNYIYQSSIGLNTVYSKDIFTLEINEETDLKMLKDFTDELQIKNVFDIVVPKEEIERQQKLQQPKKSKEDVTLHRIHFDYYKKMSKSSYKVSIDKLLENQEDDKYIYIDLEAFHKTKKMDKDYRDSYAEEIEFFKPNHSFIATGKEDLKKITKNEIENFFTLDEVKQNYKKNEKDFNSYLYNQITCDSVLLYIIDLTKLGKIKNKKINQAIDLYKETLTNYSHERNFPAFADKVYKNDPKMVKCLSIINTFDKLISEDKLFMSSYEGMKEKKNMEEMLQYVNWKYNE